MQATTLTLERHGAVAVVTLNRPDKANAMEEAMWHELREAMRHADETDAIRVMVVRGAGRHFTAGIDLAMLEGLAGRIRDEDGARSREKLRRLILDLQDTLTAIERCRKPVIAAVAGFALGGGCELAMSCDLILAADSARFGQPEIKLGIMPGAGGTQRLIRAIGKSKAMELCLTGRLMDAAEAERAGLVARIVPAADLLADALKTAETIASMSLPAAMLTKDCVNRAYETTLAEGIRYERRTFHSLFATEDQKEGMAAFLEKRRAAFKNA